MSTLFFDEHGFGSVDRPVPWREVVAVGLRTTEDGPWGEDVFWLMVVRGKGTIELPGSSVGSDAVGVMHRVLPGIDSRKIIEAMGTTRERVFRLWHEGEPLGATEPEHLRARFADLLRRLGAAKASGGRHVFENLLAAWSDARRRYHGVEHLAECLRELDEGRVEPSLADPVELALWYHDAVYVPGATDNESSSATWLAADAERLGIPADRTNRAAALVLATAPDAAVTDGDLGAALIHDIDFSILGRDALRFLEYEHGVCEEYASMPWWKLRLGRRRFLARVLASPAVYRTAHFRRRYEDAARANVAALLGSTRYAGGWWRSLVAACSGGGTP
jgi:predicted metal-dependent HD superfamily phosphohydrolase